MKKIFVAVVGSRGYGVNDPDSDTDILGIAIEPPEAIFGLGNFEQSESKSDEGQTTIYGLRKYIGLCLKGNPTVNELLWATPIEKVDPYAQWLVELRSSLVSKKTLKSYFHYMDDQIQRLKGLRGQMNVNRADLIAKHGFDTKYAYHIVRLGLMGQVLGQTGKIYMPVDPLHQTILRGIRNGEWPLEKVLQTAETGKAGIEHYIQYSSLPDKPDYKLAEDVVMRIYRREFGIEKV